MTNDNMKKSSSGSAGKYTSNGFVPARSTSSGSKSSSGCLPVIVFFFVSGVLAFSQYFI